MALAAFVHPGFMLGFGSGAVAAHPIAGQAEGSPLGPLVALHLPEFDDMRYHERMFASLSRSSI